jgi:hypothetical protein
VFDRREMNPADDLERFYREALQRRWPPAGLR